MSYDRPKLQITLNNLPTAVQQQTELWVVKSELKAYRKEWASKVKSIEVWPDHIDCVPKKRQWLAQNIREDYMVFDDDVGLYVWDRKEQRYYTSKDKPKAFTREILEELPLVYQNHDVVALSSKFMAEQHARQSLIKENTVGFVATGFRSGVIRKLMKQDRIWFNKTFMFTDLALPLQVFRQTMSSVCYYGLVYNHSSMQALNTTATATYRDDFLKLENAIRMPRLFPGVIVGAKFNNTKGGGVTIQKFFSRVLKGVTEDHIQASRDWVKSACLEAGLKRKPKLFQYEDQMPRAEIIQTFKDNWEKAK